MVTRICAFVLVLGVSAAVLGQNPGDDLKKMQGSWTAVVIEEDGQAVPPDEQKAIDLKVVIEGDGYKTFYDGKLLTTGTLKVDASKHFLDAHPKDGPYKDKIQTGIYRFDGESFYANFAKPGRPRPTQFKTRDNSEEVLIRYVKMK